MQSGCRGKIRNQCAGSCKLGRPRRPCRDVLLLLVAELLLCVIPAWAGPAENPELSLPDAPQPQNSTRSAAPATAPCPAANVTKPAAPAAGTLPASPGAQPATQPASCTPHKEINWYMRFINGPHVKPMTPSEKAWLAARNVEDPFNALTILSLAAIGVGSNSHSPVGPGMAGWGRYVGLSYTQDMTGEFFGTFLIPSIVHQDPHYHRMPKATIKRRMGHAIEQVVWTLGDNGKPMVNYADIVGFAIDEEFGNFYIPGRRTNLPSSAKRYGIDLATAPIDNFITEFLPDVARRIHIHDVLLQSIINQVAKTSAP